MKVEQVFRKGKMVGMAGILGTALILWWSACNEVDASFKYSKGRRLVKSESVSKGIACHLCEALDSVRVLRGWENLCYDALRLETDSASISGSLPAHSWVCQGTLPGKKPKEIRKLSLALNGRQVFLPLEMRWQSAGYTQVNFPVQLQLWKEEVKEGKLEIRLSCYTEGSISPLIIRKKMLSRP